MSLKALSKYLSHYQGMEDWHLPAFRQIQSMFTPRKVLYPGSWIHLTPSLVFPHVVYVDNITQMKKMVKDPFLQQYITQHREYAASPKIEVYQKSYESNLGEEASFDLLLSLSAGFISQACSQYLRTNGFLFVNNEHFDATRAYVDSQYELIGVFKTATKYISKGKNLQSYFLTRKDTPITLEMVQENSLRSPSKIRYKLKQKALFYVFKKS
jgi:hypothetical protein